MVVQYEYSIGKWEIHEILDINGNKINIRRKFMHKKVKMLYLYNSGIMISYRNEAILIDGLFNDDNPFDRMPYECREDLLNKNGIFKNLKCLLFTHCHKDHYDEKGIEDFISKHKDTIIVTPEKVNNELLRSSSGCFKVGGFEISFVETGHIGPGFETCRHYVYKICVGEKKIIVTGDMDTLNLNTVLERFGTDTSVFLINPAMLMYEMKTPETTLLNEVSNLYIYHIPSEGKDELGYRMMTKGIFNKVKKLLGDVKILDENMLLYVL